MNCPNCFSPLRPGAKFCDVCGTQIDQTHKAAAAAEEDAIEIPAVADPWEEKTEQPAPTKPWEPVKAHPEATKVWEPSESPQQANPWEQQSAQSPQQPYPWEQQPEPSPQQPYPWEQQGPVTRAADPWQPAEAQPSAPTPQAPQPSPSGVKPPVSQYADQYSQQYQKYQQSHNAGTRKGDGSLPPQKNNMPLIITAVVLAVLLLIGGIIALVFVLGAKNNKSGDPSASAFSQASGLAPVTLPTFAADTTAPQPTDAPETTAAPPTGEPTQPASSEPATAASEPTQATEAPVIDSHAILDESGNVLVRDEAINTRDEETEEKLDEALADKDDIEIFGNTVVYEIHWFDDQITPEGREKADQQAKQLLDAARSGTQVENIVVAAVCYNEGGHPVYTSIAK